MTSSRKPRAYIEAQLAGIGYTPQAQVFDTDGRPVRNIEVVFAPRGADASTPSLVVGAHYDSAGEAPGANDNGTGTRRRASSWRACSRA